MSQNGKTNERGIVSIFVTMIMMIVISLIVIGFAQIARHNQRESLDRQLSSQAYYAAESGVNAAVHFFATPGNQDAAIDTLTSGDCQGFVNGPLGGTFGSTNNLNGSNIAYTCLMVNSTPTFLEANPVTQDSNIIWHVQNSVVDPVTGKSQAFSSLTFTWKSDTNTSFHPSATNNCRVSGSGVPTVTLPARSNWNCPFAILRVDLTDASSLNAAALENDSTTKTIFMVPGGLNNANPVVVKSTSANQPVTVVQPICSKATDACSVTVNGLASGEYYARVTSVYQDSSDVRLESFDPSGGSGLTFKDGQAVIDATGKAQDVLRRIQVRIPLVKSEGNVPIFGLQSTEDICKQLTVGSTVYDKGSCTN